MNMNTFHFVSNPQLLINPGKKSLHADDVKDEWIHVMFLYSEYTSKVCIFSSDTYPSLDIREKVEQDGVPREEG